MNKKQIMQKILIFFAIIIGSLFLQQKVNAETFQPIGTGTTNRNATNAYVNTQNWGSVKIWQYTTGGSNSVTDKLAGTTLKTGESAEVEIILTWINSEDNLGVLINTAEINKDHNEYGVPDRDSTPGNNVPGEDDIDDAPVMVTIKTGS